MGKDLEGTELGTCFSQLKNGLYKYKKNINNHSYVLYNKDFKQLKKDVEERQKIFEIKESVRKYTIDKKYISYGYVYFISDGQYIKIGIAEDIQARMKTLQIGNARKLALMNCIFTEDPFKLEKAFHMVFSNRHISGEWFDLMDLFEGQIPINKDEIKNFRSMKQYSNNEEQ